MSGLPFQCIVSPTETCISSFAPLQLSGIWQFFHLPQSVHFSFSWEVLPRIGRMCKGQWDEKAEKDLVLTLELPHGPSAPPTLPLALSFRSNRSTLFCAPPPHTSHLPCAFPASCYYSDTPSESLLEQELVTQGLRDSLLVSPFHNTYQHYRSAPTTHPLSHRL